MTIEGGRPSPLHLQALNEMIDNQAKHLAAVQNRVPNIVFLALYSVAIVAFVFVGYANGLQERGQRHISYGRDRFSRSSSAHRRLHCGQPTANA